MTDDAKPAEVTMGKLRDDAPVTAGEIKQASLTLEYVRLTDSYEVKQIVNSTFYKPGDWLKAPVLEKICHMRGWTVVMIEKDLHISLPIPFLGGLF